MVGFDAVVDMANRAGMNYKIQPTPAVALGAYEITPLEAAGAYTIFANDGDYLKPSFLSHGSRAGWQGGLQEQGGGEAGARSAGGLPDHQPDGRGAAHRHGGRRARALQPHRPAAGKTGTSHDGWFAGYTTELLCVVWVGFDDNRELNLEGAHSAAPIWAEFMKRALEFREYRDVKPFRAPDGIVSISIDPESGMPATPSVPRHARKSTSPAPSRSGSARCTAGEAASPRWRDGIPHRRLRRTPPAHAAPTVTGSQGDGQVSTDPVARRAARQASGQAASSTAPPAAPKDEPKKDQKKGIFQRLWRVFK